MRIRVHFAKTGKVRWTSHRDVARMWERAFRRTNLPLAYSVGFSPRPKVSFGLALSTGHESLAEYLVVELLGEPDVAVDIPGLPAKLSAALPDGIDVITAGVIDDRRDSLQHEVTSCTWELVAAGATLPQLRELAATALAADAIVITRTRKGQPADDDVRPAILAVEVHDSPEPPDEDGRPCARITADLATQPRGLRPAELLAALDPSLEEVRVRRTHQWISRADGARAMPLDEGLIDPPDALGEPPVPQLERVS
jgi:radical SAM-linked protein